MLDGYTVEEIEFLAWAMKAILDHVDRKISWREHMLILIVLDYLVESGKYELIHDEKELFTLNVLKSENCTGEQVRDAVQ